MIPKCPFGIPGMNVPRSSLDQPFAWLPLFFNQKPRIPGSFQHILGEGFWGLQIAFSGEDDVDMLSSGESCVFMG